MYLNVLVENKRSKLQKEYEEAREEILREIEQKEGALSTIGGYLM